MSNLNYSDRVQYTLFNKAQGSLIIKEPIGWQSDEKELARHEKYHGIISRFSNSSKFIGDGKDFIQLVYDLEGINAEIKLTREEKHPQTDVWILSYSGYLDLSTWETENNQLSVKFNSGGLEQLLKARESEQVEIDRTTTIDGKSISTIPTIITELEGRRIFLKSKWESKIEENIANSVGHTSRAGDTGSMSSGVPFELISKSHESAQKILEGSIVDQEGESGGTYTGDTGMMFIADVDKDRILDVLVDLSFAFSAITDHVDWAYYAISVTKYNNGISYNVVDRYIFFELASTNDIYTASGKNFKRQFSQKIDLKKGESLAIESRLRYDLINVHSGQSDAKIYCDLKNISGTLFVKEDSFCEKSTTKAVLTHELMDKLVTIGTNKEKAFYSDFVGRTDLGYLIDGPGSLTGITHGFWVRGFDKLPIPTEIPKVENLFKPVTTSFKDAVQSLDAVWNVGIGIETIGNKERVRLEELSYFYDNNITIRLPFQVKNVKRSVATNYYYSGLEFGSEKGGDYEEACGLDEYNVKATFTTVISRLKETYSKISKYRFDSYGMEFARRKPKSLNDTEDSKYDSDIFLLDLKRDYSSFFAQRKWNDDFEKEPTGVFNPETATNLRFSTFNCLLRHSWWFGGGFKKYMTDYVHYGSSTTNSQLKTKLIGKNEYSENGKIINSELSPARFFPEWIEFEAQCTFDIMQMVEGKTIIQGKEIMNFYGLVEFINERNEIEKGFLFNLKPNGKGSWKLLKANR